MMDDYYNGNELVREYSAYGTVELNTVMGVARLVPFIEQRQECIIDSSVHPDTDIEDIPPHLKYMMDLFFINTPAIYPTKHMIQCVSPGKLQTYTGKVWEDIPYRPEWSAWENYIEGMETIKYPFVVVPNQDIYPRTFRLMDNSKMELFKTLLHGNNRQVSLKEFETRWAPLFNPDNVGKAEFPIAAWMHVCVSPNSYVDVITVNPDRTVNVHFTVPPLMSLNQDQSSVLSGKTTINIEHTIMRARSESAVVPHSGEERLLNTFSADTAEPKELSKHLKMWKVIYDHFGWKFITDADNDLNNDKVKKQNANREYEDQMEDIEF